MVVVARPALDLFKYLIGYFIQDNKISELKFLVYM